MEEKMNINEALSKFYIAIDFDGTIVENRFPLVGEEIESAVQYIKQFKALGAIIILWTVRSGSYLLDAVSFCKNRGIIFDGININPNQKWSDSPKAHANVYIDDCALGIPLKKSSVDWSIAGPLVSDRIKNALGS